MNRGDMATTTRRSAAEESVDTASRQITELAHAFREYSRNVPGLKVDIVGHVAGSQQYVHPVAGFHVRLNGESGSGISLYVSSRYGELVRWRQGALPARVHDGAISASRPCRNARSTGLTHSSIARR
jgi:hypothetical protein